VAPVFEHQVSVRWRDTDALGHVNNAVYLTYLEEGRDAFYLRALGDPSYVVVRLEIDFRAEVRYADRTVRVEITVERLGTTSLTTHETLRTADGELAAEARVITVRWDQESRTAVPFSNEQRARLAEFATSPGHLGREHKPQQPSASRGTGR
jgi:acyl-CoA thioester hydrolase